MQHRAAEFERSGAVRLPSPSPLPATTSVEQIFFSARDFYSSLERDIRAAQESICMEMYIWSNDEIGRHFFGLLDEAARRGVKVRLLLDGVGSYFWIRAQGPLMRESAVATRIWRPVEFRKIGSGGISQAFGRLNRRNHKKVVIIDDRLAYTGSLNITRTALRWKECGLRIEGASVGLLHELFEDVWEKAATDSHRDPLRGHQLQGTLLRSRLVRSNQSFVLRRAHIRSLRRRVKNARRRVWLMTPYFVPTFGFFLALLQAARRGVDVRIVLPRKSDVWFLRWVARLYYRYMLKAGVRVYEWLPEILHAKASLIDDWAAIGSSNLNRRSAYLDLELDVVISKDSARELEGEFMRTFAASEKILRYEPLDRWRNFLAKLFYLGRKWL